MKKAFFIISLCLLPTFIWAQPFPPEGWRFPMESDFTEDWQACKNKVEKTPCHIKADFIGDGLQDDAWILISKNSRSCGLFVFMTQRDGTERTIMLDNDCIPTGMGIDIANIGEYKTACSKGYWECKEGEPETLKLIHPGIDYFRFESANSIFWWEEKTKGFKRTWISD